MRRGTEAGRAYVAITADGDGINEEIVDSVDSAGPGVERAGEDHGDAYGDSFASRLRERFGPDMADRLREIGRRAGGAGGDEAGTSFSSRLVRRIGDGANAWVARLQEQGDEAGTAAGESAGQSFTDRLEERLGDNSSGGSDSVFGAIFGRDPDEAAATAGESAADSFTERVQERLEETSSGSGGQSVFGAIFGRESDNAASEAGDSAGDSFTTRLLDRLEEESEGIAERVGAHLGEDTGDAFGDSFGDSINERIEQSLSDDSDGIASRVGTSLGEDTGDAFGESFGERMEQTLAQHLDEIDERVNERMRSVSRNTRSSLSNDRDRDFGDGSGFGDRFGRAFGRGSRNNALNLIGASVGNLINLSERLTSAGLSVGRTFMDGFRQAGEGASTFQGILSGITQVGGSGLSGFAKFFSTLSASGPAMIALSGAAFVLIGVMSALVSVVGALAGILTALVSTVASGLVGALLVAAPLLAAAATAGGLLAVAFTSMTDAQSGLLKSTFQPLKAELTGIGQLMITQIIPYFDSWSRNLQNALLLIAPLAQRMGDVFGRAGNVITSALSGPGFQILFSQLGVYLPNIIMSLSRALGGFLNGIAGTFGALMPLVSRFSSYLQGVAERFSNWANSAGGQNAIVDFANRAVNSLLSLWNFVRQLGGLLSDVLFSPSAQRAGNSIFDGLADAIGRARNAISDGSLEKWFTDAINFGSTLWSVIKALKDVFVALYNAGVLEAVGDAFVALADVFRVMAVFLEPVVNLMGFIGPVATAIIAPISAAVGALEALGDRLGGVASAMGGLLGLAQQLGVFDGAGASGSQGGWVGAIGNALSNGLQPAVTAAQFQMPDFNLQDLITSGNTALNATSIANGGYMPEPTEAEKPKWKNPYLEFANSLIAAAPTVQEQMRKALRQMNKAVKDTLTEAAKALGADQAQDLLSGQIDTLRDSGNSLVEQAQSTLSASAERLANAASKKEAKQALKEVKANQAALAAAQDQQAMLIRASNILARQTFTSPGNVAALLAGRQVNATIADYAEAREQLATQLENANQALADAIAMRDDYAAQVTDAAKAFGSILTAQAQTLNGVQQVLTAGDITANLTDRLEKLRVFQDNLRILLSRGLSQDAYKQLVDGGVEQGGAYVDALVAGGQGAVAEVNNLTGQINDIASQLGGEAANNLYQAGVSAAQGLVDGLNSLSGQLESAAARLGQTIALEIRRSLGIASPSRVLMADMDHVGDGMAIGLDNQRNKVGSAAARLSQSVALSPSLAAAYAEGRVPSAVGGVSGNQGDPRFRDLIVQTPSEDPMTVAREVLNEVTGRLP